MRFSSRKTILPQPEAIREALEAAFRQSGIPVQIEVETIDQLKEALKAGAKSVMLDNFSLEKHA